VRQSIRGYADGIIEQSPSSETLGQSASELAAVADLIRASDDLHRVLLDPGVPVTPRRNVVRELFAGRVGDTTLRLLLYSIDVDRAPELLDNVSWMSARMAAASSGLRPASDTVLGRRAAEERVDGYASAALERIEREPELTSVEDDLFRFHQIIDGSLELGSALTNRQLPADVRRKIVTDLLSGRASPVATALAAYATQVGRSRDYQTLLLHLVDRVAAERHRRLAEVRSAVALDDTQQQQLASALSGVIGHDVEVRVTVDPQVLAGFVATIGDTVVDGSARRRLEQLKERLVLPEVTLITGETTDG
jgi:F-type H+-transporting ATPase subunit delta